MNTHKYVEGLIKQCCETLFLDVKAAQESMFDAGRLELSVYEIEQSKTARA
jgi:hypothetical protein